MSRRPSGFVSPEQAMRNESAPGTRAHLLDIKADRPRRIDQYLDYFGGGRERGVPSRIVREGQPAPRD